ncbi:hypothetical protein SUGI_0451690 [Cryptomeria japonica]|nr:hypothetical protein SUGI_0451690 [Cryptomeria japonica]
MNNMEHLKCEADVTVSGECECMEALSIEFSDYFRIYRDELTQVIKLCFGTAVPNPSELLQQYVPANMLRNRASEAYRKDLHRRISHIDYFTNGVAITVTCLFVGRYLAQFSNSNPEQSRNRRAIPVEDSNSYILPEKMVEGETMKKIPCKHEYHEECIDKWLASSNLCPLCKHELPTDDLDYEQRKKQIRA